MYNKLFVKILDSSIWLEPTPTRICWITLLAAMDEDGYAHFSALENLAQRARVSLEEAKAAVECFEAPDPNSGDPDHEGRRIERVPGGFMILNAEKHRDTLNRVVAKEQNRLRVKRFREKHACEDGQTVGKQATNGEKTTNEAQQVYGEYPRKVGKPAALKRITKAIKEFGFEYVMERTKAFKEAWVGATDLTFCPHPATWFHAERFNDDPKTWVGSSNQKKGAEPGQLQEEIGIPQI
jgi:hypothetical protein